MRGKRGVSLTPAGEVFYRQCKQLMIRYNDAAAQGKKIALGNATDLRIGYAGAYELWTIVAQIRKYHRLYPEAAFSFQLGSNRSLLTALAEGRLDMAVLSGFGRRARYRARQLRHACRSVRGYDQRRAPAGGKGRDPSARAQGHADRAQPCAGQSALGRTDRRMYASMGLGGNPRMYADDFYGIALIIHAGLAVSIMPASMADWGISGVVFRPLHGFRAKARTLLVYPCGSQDTGIQSFVSLIRPKR